MHLTKEDVLAVGSTLNYRGADIMIRMQKEHMAGDPNKIPLAGMMDVIHGCRTIYPVPLALGCTFEPELVEKLCAMAAKEATAYGIQVTFAPMADLARDARWGRVVETTGEDPYMNSLYAAAATRGFQGDDLSDETKVAACLKHFASYGAAEAGRDYNTVDMSERTAREFYWKAYKAAVDAGVAMAMTSFNVYDGIPLTANKHLTQDVLRKEWGFDGVIISDYNAFGEMTTHGYEQDGARIADRAFEAGEDIEMMSLNYLDNMEKLVKSGKISESELDEYVFRILKLKRDLGLFDNPLRGMSAEREKSQCLTDENRALAREAAEKSAVLIKNEQILPLKAGKIALIGPFADTGEIIGTWRCYGEAADTVTVKAAMEKTGLDFAYAAGCDWKLKSDDVSGFEEAVAVAPTRRCSGNVRGRASGLQRREQEPRRYMHTARAEKTHRRDQKSKRKHCAMHLLRQTAYSDGRTAFVQGGGGGVAARNGRRQRNSQSVDGQGQLLGKTLHDVPLSRRAVPHILQPYVHRQTKAERRFRRLVRLHVCGHSQRAAVSLRVRLVILAV